MYRLSLAATRSFPAPVTLDNILLLPGQQFNGSRLEIARENSQLSRAELAERSETSPSFITACEKGRKKPSKDLEAIIAHILGVRTSFFYVPMFDPWTL